MNDWLDTVLNIQVFLFIGLLFWLYFKDFPKGHGEPPKAEGDHD